MAWKKGQSGNKAGRPRRNEEEKRNIQEFRKKLREHSLEALDIVIDIMESSFDQNLRFKACMFIIDKTFGREYVAEQVEEQARKVEIKLLPVEGKPVDCDMVEKEINSVLRDKDNITDDDDWGIDNDDWDDTDIYAPEEEQL